MAARQAKPKKEAKPTRFQIVTAVIVPIATFAVGWFGQQYVAARKHSLQQFTLASNLLQSPDPVIKSWARSIVDQYANSGVALQTSGTSTVALGGIPLDILERLCPRPDEYFLKFPDRMGPDLQKTDLPKDDLALRLALINTDTDYRSLRIQYNGLIEVLRSTCGFLMPDWRPPSRK